MPLVALEYKPDGVLPGSMEIESTAIVIANALWPVSAMKSAQTNPHFVEVMIALN
jgi:hypothetical protein